MVAPLSFPSYETCRALSRWSTGAHGPLISWRAAGGEDAHWLQEPSLLNGHLHAAAAATATAAWTPSSDLPLRSSGSRSTCFAKPHVKRYIQAAAPACKEQFRTEGFLQNGFFQVGAPTAWTLSSGTHRAGFPYVMMSHPGEVIMLPPGIPPQIPPAREKIGPGNPRP